MNKMTKLNVFCVCCLFIVNFMSQKVVCAPQDAYNYANKAIRGATPIEDHEQHLAHVALAYQQTDQNYNNYLDVRILN